MLPMYDGIGVGHHDDHLARCAAGNCFVDGRGRIDEHVLGPEPVVVVVRVAMQQVDDRVAIVRMTLVAGRQIDRDVAIRRVALQISFERFPVHLDALDRAVQCGRVGAG